MLKKSKTLQGSTKAFMCNGGGKERVCGREAALGIGLLVLDAGGAR